MCRKFLLVELVKEECVNMSRIYHGKSFEEYKREMMQQYAQRQHGDEMLTPNSRQNQTNELHRQINDEENFADQMPPAAGEMWMSEEMGDSAEEDELANRDADEMLASREESALEGVPEYENDPFQRLTGSRQSNVMQNPENQGKTSANMQENTNFGEAKRKFSHVVPLSLQDEFIEDELSRTNQSGNTPEDRLSAQNIPDNRAFARTTDSSDFMNRNAAAGIMRDTESMASQNQMSEAIHQQEMRQQMQRNANIHQSEDMFVQNNFRNIENSQDPKLDQYLSDNPGMGFLELEVFIGQRAYPIKGAIYKITKQIGGQEYTFHAGQTNESGKSERISLPAPDQNRSMQPQPVGSTQPYAAYDLRVEYPNYIPIVARNIPIFDQVLSLQPVALQPASKNGSVDTLNEQEPEL